MCSSPAPVHLYDNLFTPPMVIASSRRQPMSGTEDRSKRTIDRDGRRATTRRQFLRQMMGVTGGAALASLLDACGGQVPAAGGDTAAPAAGSAATSPPAPTEGPAAATAAPAAPTAAPAAPAVAASGGGKITLRQYACAMRMGRATPDELATMRRVMAKAMEDGAFGVAYALIYPPESFVDTDVVCR
jgi:hypothetical protein